MGVRLASPSRARLRNGKPALVYAGVAQAPTAPGFTTAGDIGVIGDSLTDISYDSAGYRLGLPLMMYPPRLAFNAGAAGDPISRTADRFQGVIDSFPNINTWMIRIGTNGPGANTTYAEQYNRIISTLAANKKVGIFHSVPPRGAGTPGVDSPNIAVNAWLKAACDTAPVGQLYFVDDSMDMGDANYNAIAGYYVDETDQRIHPNGKGIVAEARRMAPRLAAIFPHVDPRISDANDTYAKNPASNQYVSNPMMAGSVAVSGAITGSMPTGWTLSNGNFGGTGAAVSTIPADAGDTVQSPWLRIGNITSGGNGSELWLHHNLTHPAIAADTTIKRFDVIAEVRFNALDTSVISRMVVTVDDQADAQINLSGNPGVMTEHMVVRHSLLRTQQNYAGNAKPLIAYAANSMSFALGLSFSGQSPGSIGSVDIRCVSVRGQTD